MKKILALVLALMLVFSTSVVAFAADVTQNNGTDTGNVEVVINPSTWTGDYNDVDPTTATYEVDIDLIDITFTYTFGTYDTDTHEYSSTGWDKQAGDITVKNHSNTSLDVTASFPASQTTATQSGVTATLNDTKISLGSAVGLDVDTETPEDDINVSIEGVPTVTTGYTLTTVTLTIEGK